MSFVPESSDYLYHWFGNRIVTSRLLSEFPAEVISFTFGDSGANYKRTKQIRVYTKEMLLSMIAQHPLGMEAFLKEAEETYHYIEAQLWVCALL